MNTEQPTEKTLGQIAFEAMAGPYGAPWKAIVSQYEFHAAASAVEQAVLERLPGEWVLLKVGTKTAYGDRKYITTGRTGWRDLMQPGWITGPCDVVIRRIQPEVKAEPSNPQFGVCPQCGVRRFPEFTHICSPPSEFLSPSELRAMLGGREPHRSDGWRREWLTDGWRPLLYGEAPEKGDEYQDGYGKWGAHDGIGGGPSRKEHNHQRSRRPLPPTTEQKPEGEGLSKESTVPCCLCGGAVEEFSVPNADWNRIVRKNGSETDKEYLCWACFEKKILEVQKDLHPPVGESPPAEADVEPVLERYCEVMHDAYEAAAIGEGWNTQEASRKPWRDVPEANRRTMRCAVKALMRHLAENPLIDWKGFHDSLKRQADDKIATLTKERDEALKNVGLLQVSYDSAESRANQAEALNQADTRTIIRITTERDEAQLRAMQAEKKLAEVEVERGELREAGKTAVEQWKMIEQKLQQAEASVPRWVPVSKHPQECDSINGKLWFMGINRVVSLHRWDWNHGYDTITHWMTPVPPPLPTPIEEKDAFEEWWKEMNLDDKETAKIAWNAALASNSTLTKD